MVSSTIENAVVTAREEKVARKQWSAGLLVTKQPGKVRLEEFLLLQSQEVLGNPRESSWKCRECTAAGCHVLRSERYQGALSGWLSRGTSWSPFSFAFPES